MKAWIRKEPYKLELVDLPEPDMKENDVLVKIAWTGLCGSDVEGYKGTIPKPAILGHESAGVVKKVGKRVSGIREGDHVALRSVWKGFAEYVNVPQFTFNPQSSIFNLRSSLIPQIKKLPLDLPLIEGTIVEVLPAVINAVERGKITSETDVVILGQGVSGLLLTQVAKLYRPTRLIAVDFFSKKLELSKNFGATHTVETKNTQITKDKVLQIIPDGADVVIIACPGEEGIEAALELVKYSGKIILYGNIQSTKSVDFHKLHMMRADILTTKMENLADLRKKFNKSVEYLQEGIVDAGSLITHKFPLRKLPEAFRLKENPREDVIHVLINCNL